MADGQPFVLGGIWEVWAGRAEFDEGYTVHTCAVLTTGANDLMAPVHDRMPVIVAPSSHDLWLAPDFRDCDRIEEVLQPFDPVRMVAYPVSHRVDCIANDGSDLTEIFPHVPCGA